MQATATVNHTFTVRESDELTITWECACGWLTIETIDAPEYHIPIEQRKADHLREAAAIEDGTVMLDLPDGHRYVLFLRRRLSGNTPNQIVVWAKWTGGFREIKTWGWNETGLAEALAWCGEHYTTWKEECDGIYTTGGNPVEADELTRRVLAAL